MAGHKATIHSCLKILMAYGSSSISSPARAISATLEDLGLREMDQQATTRGGVSTHKYPVTTVYKNFESMNKTAKTYTTAGI